MKGDERISALYLLSWPNQSLEEQQICTNDRGHAPRTILDFAHDFKESGGLGWKCYKCKNNVRIIMASCSLYRIYV